MTTPAINRNNITTIVGNLVTQQYDNFHHQVGPATSGPFSNVNTAWDKELRPASGTVSFGTDRFRSCRAWTHSGRLLYNRTGRVTRYFRSSPSLWTEQRYEDGCFWAYNPVNLPGFPSRVQSKAELKALERLKNQDIHLGNFLAESGEVIDMVGSTLHRIAAGVRSFRGRIGRRGWTLITQTESGFDAGRRLRNQIPNDWLQLQYGWKPLMSDVYGAINALSANPRPEIFRVTGRASEAFENIRGITAAAGTSKLTVKQTGVWQADVSLWYQLNNQRLATLSSLGLINPVEIVWECLPYSFVVDWFSPVSSWLAALTADVGYTFKSGSLSRVTKGRDEVDNIVWENTPTLSTSGDVPFLQGPGDYDFIRTCYSSTPVPGLYFKNPLSLLHVLNGLALLVQAFK